MKITKTTEKKYPLKVTLANGTVLRVPCQKYFDNEFLRCHGCSLMAEYLALQYLGYHKYPLHLLQWHRTHDKEDIKLKVTLKGVTKGINHFKKGHATYIDKPTVGKANYALLNGGCIILEHKNPIHTVFIFRDNGIDYIVSYGKVSKVNITRTMKKKSTNKTYRGMVIVK